MILCLEKKMEEETGKAQFIKHLKNYYVIKRDLLWNIFVSLRAVQANLGSLMKG